MNLFCLYAGLCSGCDLLNLNRSQIEKKRGLELHSIGIPVDQLGEKFSIVWIEGCGLRDRVELVVERAKFDGRLKAGLFVKTHSANLRHGKPLVEIAGCAQFSPSLEHFYQNLIADLPPVSQRGSLRLRVGPRGECGLWLDFSNEDIRDVLNEEQWLIRTLNRGWIVEMGQRRKRVMTSTEGRRFRLVDPVLAPWFQTWIDGEAYDLFSTIGTFTQPGIVANQALVRTVVSFIQKNLKNESTAVEFGCGIGNFTLPLASLFKNVSVFETDRLALEGLSRGLQACGLESRVTIHTGDFIRSSKNVEIGEPDLILVDPPRSGLDQFLEILQNPAARKANWVYVSCFPESLGRDLRVLRKAGFTIDAATVIEQFPFTRHYELVVALKSPPVA